MQRRTALLVVLHILFKWNFVKIINAFVLVDLNKTWFPEYTLACEHDVIRVMRADLEVLLDRVHELLHPCWPASYEYIINVKTN